MAAEAQDNLFEQFVNEQFDLSPPDRASGAFNGLERTGGVVVGSHAPAVARSGRQPF